MKENKSKSLRLTLARLMKFYNELITEQGVLATEGEFEVGAEVYALNEGGEFVPAADGAYVVEDTTYTVSAGVITAIEKAEAPVEPTEPETPAEEMQTETPAEENLETEQAAEETPAEETDERDARIAELEGIVAERDARVAELEGIVAERDARIAELEAIVEDYRTREEVTEPSVEEEDLALAKQEPVKKEDNVSKGVALMRAIRGAKGE